MRTKIMATVAILVMLAAGFIAIIGDKPDAAVTSSGEAEYKFFVADGTDSTVSTWDVYTGEGYNAFHALYYALTQAEIEDINFDYNYTMTVGTAPNDYLTINPNFGTVYEIDRVGGDVGCQWYVYMYSPVQESWIAGPVNALGFYQAYSDYDASLRAANYILYYSDSATIDSRFTMPTSGLIGLADVTSTNVFKVKFNVSIQSGLSKPDDITTAQWTYLQNHQGTYYGYGSNAYLALKNAISNVTGNNEMYDTLDGAINYDSYGYFDSLLNVSECHTESQESETVEGGTLWTVTSIWDYWSVYPVISGSPTYSSFTLGFMSPISDLGYGFSISEFNLVYCESEYQYQYLEASE